MRQNDLKWWDQVALPTIRKFRALGALLFLVGGVLSLFSFFLFGGKELGLLILALFGGIGAYYYIILPLILEEGFYKESKICRLFVETHFVYLYRSKVNKED